jgi:hypothetical protein
MNFVGLKVEAECILTERCFGHDLGIAACLPEIPNSYLDNPKITQSFARIV